MAIADEGDALRWRGLFVWVGGGYRAGMRYQLGIIGAGNMAEAIVRGILSAKVMGAEQIVAADVSAERRELFTKQLGVRAVEDNREVAGEARSLLLAVKPYQVDVALGGIGSVLHKESLVVSIMAAITTASIEKHLGGGVAWRVVRAMPNTPMLVEEGMVGLAAGKHATPEDMTTARRMFEAAAEVIEVEEAKIDAVTAVSGSGPAYFFYLVEQMIAAGVKLGLTADQARVLATQTAAGAAKMMQTTGTDPAELRRKVTTPGGTTAAAIEVMEKRGMPEMIAEALARAEQRAREMAK
jgi:pyrroline-5-carboxylate reductase